MTANSDARAWLALKMVAGIGPVVYRQLLQAFGCAEVVLGAETAELVARGVRPTVAREIAAFDRWDDVDDQLRRLERCDGSLVTWIDDRYPARLRQIHDPPPVLFVRGMLVADDDVAVAVVGSRAVSPYGRRMARRLSAAFAARGVTVVSGLARGIDAVAHAACLEAGGRTIAVLGSGIDVIYPPEHRGMAEAIAGAGAVVSELPMGTKPDAENFPSRNRLISGLSRGVVVVEAAERSGSLITARVAGEQGRDVFAVPGPVGAATAGTHRLLREGAKLTECADDVLEEVCPRLLRESAGRPTFRPTPEEGQVLAAIGRETVHVDTVILRCGWPANEVLPLLLALELKGVVEQAPGKFFSVRG